MLCVLVNCDNRMSLAQELARKRVTMNALNNDWLKRKDRDYQTLRGSGVANTLEKSLRPEVRPLILLYTILDRKGYPFVYLQLTNGTSFTYLV